MYADSTAVIGPLSREPEPHTYDFCADHAAQFTAPRGWKVVVAPAPLEPHDDVLALARALADTTPESSRADFRRGTNPTPGATDATATPVRHLTVMRSPRNDH